MKNQSHFYRMNPQTIRRPKAFFNSSTILVTLVLAALAALFWIGKLQTH